MASMLFYWNSHSIVYIVRSWQWNSLELDSYKTSWGVMVVLNVPRNRLPRVMKHYSPTGRRDHGRSLKRLMDTWDRNGPKSGPTPWQIYDDDDNDDDYCVSLLAIAWNTAKLEGKKRNECKRVNVVCWLENCMSCVEVLNIVARRLLNDMICLLTHWGREGSFKLFKRPFQGFFLTILTL